jgi:uncharacterized MnhB-related membrane protein/RNA polymerase subunit RPABC4/transcription elongation factor Spt4
MARKCPYCGGKATRGSTSSTALVFGGRRFDNFPCESCGAAVRISRTIPWISFVLTMLAILGAIVVVATQGLIPGLVWAVVVGVVVSVFELFIRVDKVAFAPPQAPAQSAVPQAGEYKRCATCDQLYSAQYDGCPFCARRDVPSAS